MVFIYSPHLTEWIVTSEYLKCFQFFKFCIIEQIYSCVFVCMSVEVGASVHIAVNVCESERNVGAPLDGSPPYFLRQSLTM